MEIHFCASCNQSIPLRDIESGSAVRRGREYLCPICRYLEPPPRPRPRRSSRAWLFATLVLAAAVVVIAFVFQDELFPPAPPAKPAPPDNRAVLAALTDLEQRIRAALAGQERSAAERLVNVQRLVEIRLGEIATHLGRHETAISRLVDQIDALERRGGQALTKEDLTALRVYLRGILDEVVATRGVVEGLGKHVPAEAAQPRPPEAAKRPAPAAGSEPPRTAGFSEMDYWITRLADRDAAERHRALAALVRFRGPKVEQALVELIADWEADIRRTAATELGERKVEAAVAPLLKTLDDGDATVREAGVGALRKITGRQFGYRSDASERQRAVAADRWRQFVAALRRKEG